MYKFSRFTTYNTRTHTHTHTHTHARTHTHTQTNKQTNKNTHTHSLTSPSPPHTPDNNCDNQYASTHSLAALMIFSHMASQQVNLSSSIPLNNSCSFRTLCPDIHSVFCLGEEEHAVNNRWTDEPGDSNINSVTRIQSHRYTQTHTHNTLT